MCVRACTLAASSIFAAWHLHRRRLPPDESRELAMGRRPPGFSQGTNCGGEGQGRGSLLIVCGHVRSRSTAKWECQEVGIIADFILKGAYKIKKKPLHQHLWPQTRPPTPTTNPTYPSPPMKMMFYDPSSSLTEGLLMSFQQGGGLGGRKEVWSDGGGGGVAVVVVVEGGVGGCCARCTHAHSDQLPLCCGE